MILILFGTRAMTWAGGGTTPLEGGGGGPWESGDRGRGETVGERKKESGHVTHLKSHVTHIIHPAMPMSITSHLFI